VTYNDRLYCIREGQGDEGWLWCAKYDGTSWTDRLIPSAEDAYDTSGRPGLALFPKRTTLQKNWFYCTQCHGLFLASFGFNGVCPKDRNLQQHVPDSSNVMRFCLPVNSDTIGEPNWAKCLQCSGLFYHQPNSTAGACPVSLGHFPHVAGSGNFTLIFDRPNSPGQKDWKRCSKCKGLYFGTGGICPLGNTDHQQEGTKNYSLTFETR
jgi:hypothetical protein